MSDKNDSSLCAHTVENRPRTHSPAHLTRSIQQFSAVCLLRQSNRIARNRRGCDVSHHLTFGKTVHSHRPGESSICDPRGPRCSSAVSSFQSLPNQVSVGSPGRM